MAAVVLRLAPRTSHLAPRASCLAPRASRLAPRASHLAPRASRLVPRASRLAPRASFPGSFPPLALRSRVGGVQSSVGEGSSPHRGGAGGRISLRHSAFQHRRIRHRSCSVRPHVSSSARRSGGLDILTVRSFLWPFAPSAIKNSPPECGSARGVARLRRASFSGPRDGRSFRRGSDDVSIAGTPTGSGCPSAPGAVTAWPSSPTRP